MSVESPLRDGNGAGFELIETMRWEPATGFLRFERHLARLYVSAAELGFVCDPERIGEVLSNTVSGHGVALRVRLALRRNGEATAAAQVYEPLPADKVWRLQLARIRLDSANTLLRHKTSLRQVYAQARAEYLATRADEVLLANERGELCEGTITNLFADFGDGPLATPRLDCGLLPGILRGALLDEGRAVEAIYSFDDLKAAKAIFVGNSLRGLIPARLG
ncbi:aminotransferase class IV family protein [Mesorhizobium sp. CA18]|uniref:aminotransferase class IV family protein n=1 Tax=unclassified Mesorhizobium TaxID=325217 RepID=UPI001CCCD7B3|nr:MULTISPECIES: aminotransferase class IV family protein [unclassified Mesorhizobium]MBZ9732789.1 aminotransferase class IV family protein [Mesorhizobium sp. CA9]MBZ9824819.1 aminotransferase class IV family protein [Mesorhizobium sp. CA18]MBZ9830439.1 aminotransferase class IV family protein [Mesorhizobium sp. CA2]MBZ9836126.1 aminotransferase class IV family protein [Mesorhizobium sp. CA3]MBZ9876573.1 aminotransferase class IV family protein [Mesorhizobium sp. Ca11]